MAEERGALNGALMPPPFCLRDPSIVRNDEEQTQAALTRVSTRFSTAPSNRNEYTSKKGAPPAAAAVLSTCSNYCTHSRTATNPRRVAFFFCTSQEKVVEHSLQPSKLLYTTTKNKLNAKSVLQQGSGALPPPRYCQPAPTTIYTQRRTNPIRIHVFCMSEESESLKKAHRLLQLLDTTTKNPTKPHSFLLHG